MMSLRIFHLIFICVAALSVIFLAFWFFTYFAGSNQLLAIAGGGIASVFLLVILLIERNVWQKLKQLK